ncbi:galactoside O-acetyltransferase [Ancylomarina subtilis]|uniref:Galactoside O-acetyltransferase n=1 Tax=Ancylomarina subtilis TaxID=1639035 RepID=A0A4Q7VKW8_9BACT|nr:acyltransferase [Ancylomarina subtilis]RZT96804.1 galactoside O-acetyltransferase [Ancylomarina subtilis]
MNNPFDTGYYTELDLADAGFKSLGNNIKIAKNCTIMGLNNIAIGDNVIIDAYCTICAVGDGFLEIGSYVHIGGYCLLSAGDGIFINDFSGLSQGVKIYSRSDDYTGKYLTNPTIPEKYTGVKRGTVKLESYVIIGAESIILPDVTIGQGSSVGALSLVSRNLPEWGMYLGHPLRKLGNRSKDMLKLQREFMKEHKEIFDGFVKKTLKF